jgi:hypothetical protein
MLMCALLAAVVFSIIEGCAPSQPSARAQAAAPEKPGLVWEQLGSDTERIFVPGGWLVWRYVGYGGCLCYVPDPAHEWRIGEGK